MTTIVEILIDNSRSMGPFQVKENNGQYLLPDGSTRMNFAKSVLRDEVLPTFDYASKITVRKFHSNDKDNGNLVIETIYDRDFDTETLSQKIEEIPDPVETGGTPITDAIKYSINALSKHSEADRKIILVTDGEETGEGDYNKAANEALKLHGIPCNIFIIGIALTEAGDIKAKGLATDTGGSYINLQAKNYDRTTLQNVLRPLKKAAVAISIDNNTRLISSTATVQPISPSIPKPIVNSQTNVAQPQNLTTQSATPNSQKPVEVKPDDKLVQQFQVTEIKEITTVENVINPQEIENNMSIFSEQIEQNTTAIKLISKQLGIISEEIKSLKNVEEEDDEIEPKIKENAEINEKIRVASESFLFEKLKQKFGERVKWLNEQKESGSNHDFEVTDSLDNSIEYYIECKGSMHSEKVFYLTKYEWLFFIENTKNYQIFFVSNALNNPEITKIDNFKDWIFKGKIVPFAFKNTKLKAERIVFTIIEQ